MLVEAMEDGLSHIGIGRNKRRECFDRRTSDILVLIVEAMEDGLSHIGIGRNKRRETPDRRTSDILVLIVEALEDGLSNEGIFNEISQCTKSIALQLCVF